MIFNFKLSKLSLTLVTAVGLAAIMVGCATTTVTGQDIVAELKGSFADKGVATLDRLNQTPLQAACSEAAESGKELDPDVKAKIESTILENIPYPADGQYLGDWRKGEAIAQNGKGLQFSDPAGSPNGANCYACHQLTPKEISFGNQGPSLLKYGTLRGIKDPNSPDALPIVKYTWARIWNTHAFNACNPMPRFGDAGILTTDQMKDVMALLLDPTSPVNQ